MGRHPLLSTDPDTLVPYPTPFRSAASVSAQSSRLSICPTITTLAPMSASIGAATDPVKAPETALLQSCPPTAPTGVAATIGPINVKGGQIATYKTGCSADAATIACLSMLDPVEPFIYTLPTSDVRLAIYIARESCRERVSK